jgi:transglutaminase-like putative cysteine protease
MAVPANNLGEHEAPPARHALGAVHRYFETSLYLMLLTAAAALVATGKIDPLTSAVALLALLHKGVRWWRRRPPELSEAAAKRLTIAYLIFFPVDFFFVSMALAQDSQNQLLFAALLAVIHVLVFAMIVRLYSARTTRDYLFLAMVGFAQVLVSAILTIDTAFLAFLILFLLLSVSTFMGLELRRSAEGAAAPALASGTPAARRLNRALSLTTAGLSLGAVLLGTVIFLLLPRITAGFLSSYNFQPTLMSGFSDDAVQLGQIGQIKQNPAVVMRVKPLSGPLGVEYWRGDAFRVFDGVQWTSPREQPTLLESRGVEGWYYLTGRAPLDASREVQSKLLRRLREQGYVQHPFRQSHYRVFLEPIGSDKFFLATRGTAVRGTIVPGVDHVGRRRRSFIEERSDGSLSNPARNFSRMIYEGLSLPQQFPPAFLREVQGEIPEAIRGPHLQLPDLDPRIRQLTEQLTANAPTQYDKVRAVEQFLKTRYVYSLELTGASLATFLLERKAGHCEYFASAMAVMLRTVGIPTRYARGFLGGEYNDVGEDWIVRARDAHSWVEVYFPQVGWVTFDPTPAAPAGVRGFLHRLSLYWDWAELLWIDWVVNYNFQQQNVLIQNSQRQAVRWSTRWAQWGRASYDGTVAWMTQFRRRLARWASLAPGTLALLMVTATALLLYLWHRRTLLEWLAVRFGLRLGREEETRLVTLYYLQMLAVLERLGAHKRPGQTAREFAHSLQAMPTVLPLLNSVQEMTAIFEAARYGGAARLSELASALAILKAAARQAP